MASQDSRENRRDTSRRSSRRSGSSSSRTYSSYSSGRASHAYQDSSRSTTRSSSRSRYSRNSDAYASQPVNQQSTQLSTTTASSPSAFTPATGQANQYSRTNTANYSHKRARKSGRGKRIALAVVIAIAVVLVGAGTAAALFVNSINTNLQNNKTEEEKLAIQEKLVATKTITEPFYMMLIGSDGRDEENSDVEGQRSDTAILVRVDPQNQNIIMLSIPRDTKITYKGSTVKFNAAYAYDGTAGAIDAASTLCGVEISHYAEVDFGGLVDLVNAIGGVDVYVESTIDNYKAGDVIVEEGQQHLDGEHALTYARDRDYADGDFTRTKHQRILVNAILEKVMSLNVTELPGVLQTACEYVSTDLSVNDIYSLAMQFRDMSQLEMYSIMVPSTTATIDGISYVITDDTTFAAVMNAIDQGIDPNTVVVENTGSATTGTGDETASQSDDTSYDNSYSYDYTYYDNSGTYDQTYDNGTGGDTTYDGSADNSGNGVYVDNSFDGGM